MLSCVNMVAVNPWIIPKLDVMRRGAMVSFVVVLAVVLGVAEIAARA